jgi:hypothetical protein
MNEYLLESVIYIITKYSFYFTNGQLKTRKTGTQSFAEPSPVQCSLYQPTKVCYSSYFFTRFECACEHVGVCVRVCVCACGCVCVSIAIQKNVKFFFAFSRIFSANSETLSDLIKQNEIVFYC